MANQFIPGTVWCSHLPLLKHFIQLTDKPVLELGCGYGSTPQLHLLCERYNRKLISVEDNFSWASKELVDLHNNNHQIIKVSSYDQFDPNMVPIWGIVLIDHAPALRRNVEVMRLKSNTEYMILHDTECASYQYDQTIPKFKYKLTDQRSNPFTTVISDIKVLPSDINEIPFFPTLDML